MLRLITPHQSVSRLADIDIRLLQSLEIDGLLVDVDGTLMEYGGESFPEDAIAWLNRLREAGIKVCLFSNASQQRIDRLAGKLGIWGLGNALKPSPMRCRRAVSLLGSVPARVALVGDQVFADVLAGRLAGMLTILVPTRNVSEPWFTRLKRPPERWWLRWLARRSPIIHPDISGTSQPKITPKNHRQSGR